MKTFNSDSGLRRLGIEFLTGEACAFNMRLLCDLNESGCDLLRDYYGLPYDAKFAPPMNSRVNDQPSVASTMIERNAFPALIRFALFRQGYQYVYGDPEGLDYTAFTDKDVEDPKQPYLKMILAGEASWLPEAKLFRNPKSPSQPSVGSRNVHQFTGRTL